MAGKWACAFCGRSDVPRTREHVLRDNFHGKIPHQESGKFVLDQFGVPGVKRWEVPESNFDVKVNEVCGPCNHGWMNDLENRVEDVVVALANGRRPTIAPGMLRDLRFWMVKTALVKILMQRDFNVFAPLYREMFDEQGTPDGTEAQFAICSEEAPNQYGRHVWIKIQDEDLDPEPHLSVVAFGVGRLSFQVTLTNSVEEFQGLNRDVLKIARHHVKGWNPMRPERRNPLKPSSHSISASRLYQQGGMLRDVLGHGIDANDPNPIDWGYRQPDGTKP